MTPREHTVRSVKKNGPHQGGQSSPQSPTLRSVPDRQVAPHFGVHSRAISFRASPEGSRTRSFRDSILSAPARHPTFPTLRAFCRSESLHSRFVRRAHERQRPLGRVSGREPMATHQVSPATGSAGLQRGLPLKQADFGHGQTDRPVPRCSRRVSERPTPPSAASPIAVLGRRVLRSAWVRPHTRHQQLRSAAESADRDVPHRHRAPSPRQAARLGHYWNAPPVSCPKACILQRGCTAPLHLGSHSRSKADGLRSPPPMPTRLTRQGHECWCLRQQTIAQRSGRLKVCPWPVATHRIERGVLASWVAPPPTVAPRHPRQGRTWRDHARSLTDCPTRIRSGRARAGQPESDPFSRRVLVYCRTGGQAPQGVPVGKHTAFESIYRCRVLCRGVHGRRWWLAPSIRRSGSPRSRHRPAHRGRCCVAHRGVDIRRRGQAHRPHCAGSSSGAPRKRHGDCRTVHHHPSERRHGLDPARGARP